MDEYAGAGGSQAKAVQTQRGPVHELTQHYDF